MTVTLYPQGRTVENIKDGVATVVWGAARSNTSIVSDEEIKTEFGGLAEARYTESNLRRLWTPTERKTYRDFVRLFRKYVNARIPEVKQELKEQMKQDRFMGARNPHELENKLNHHMKQDARLYIKTRTGTVINSLSEQKAYSALRSASLLGDRRT